MAPVLDGEPEPSAGHGEETPAQNQLVLFSPSNPGGTAILVVDQTSALPVTENLQAGKKRSGEDLTFANTKDARSDNVWVISDQ